MKELVNRIHKYLEDNFSDDSTPDSDFDNIEDITYMFIIAQWLANKWKIVVSARPSVDPKYNNRLWYSTELFEWSRTHEFWMNKSQPIRYVDTPIEALAYGLLQGLEIAKIKKDENGTTTSK